MNRQKNIKNKNVCLVTGGAGFIGSELVRQLVAKGHKVIVVDNLINGHHENLNGLPASRVQLVIADIRKIEQMTDLMKRADIIFHLACLGVRHSIHSPYENHDVNATGTLKLLLAAKDAGIKRFIYVSSSEVYGTALWVPMTEEHPTFPTTIYGASKLAGECYTRAFYNTYRYPITIVRPFNTYGPHCHLHGDSGEVIPKFLLRCMAKHPIIIFGNGAQTRDFAYVSDIANGIMLAGFSDNTVGQTINLGSGQEININDLARTVMSIVGKEEIEITYKAPRPGDVLRLWTDTTKAKKLLGFKTKITLHEGLNRLKDWYMNLKESPDKMLEEELVQNWELKND